MFKVNETRCWTIFLIIKVTKKIKIGRDLRGKNSIFFHIKELIQYIISIVSKLKMKDINIIFKVMEVITRRNTNSKNYSKVIITEVWVCK